MCNCYWRQNSLNTQNYTRYAKNCKTVCIENSCELTLDIVKNNGISLRAHQRLDWMIREVITRMNELEKAVANANEAQETAAEPTAENTEKNLMAL